MNQVLEPLLSYLRISKVERYINKYSNPTLLDIGCGQKHLLLNRIKNNINKGYGIDENIKYEGGWVDGDKKGAGVEYINNEMTKQLFCGSDAIIQTYHSASQSGVTPLAYFYNTPVLVSNIDGLKDPVLKDKSGIVSGKSTKEISQNILKLLDNLNYYTENIKTVKSNYKWNKFVNELEKFISNL